MDNINLTLNEYVGTKGLSPEAEEALKAKLIEAAADDGDWLISPVYGEEILYSEKYWADLAAGIE